jgi:outer membrane receptor protein involved in Fe transport
LRTTNKDCRECSRRATITTGAHGRRATLVAALLVAGVAPAAFAADVPPAPAAASSPVSEPVPVQSVEIQGSGGAAGERRDANASKVVVTHEDLVRYGDNTIADALQRVSGISVVRAPGKDAEIRLRGLGNGYTQILINGQPAPTGFSIESLNPNLVDHIDVLRSPTADMSTQGIAGTINIVLKPAARTPATLKLAFAESDGRPTANAAFDVSGEQGDATWQMGFSGGLARNFWPADGDTSGRAADGSTYRFTTHDEERDKELSLAMTPQAAVKLAGGGSVSLATLLQARRVDYLGEDERTAISGDGFDFATDRMPSNDEVRLARATLEWKSRRDADNRGEARVVVSTNSREIHARFDGFDDQGTTLLERLVHSTMRDNAALAQGKGEFALGEDHTLGIGWDGQLGRRNEHRVQDESSAVGYPTTDLDQDYTARIDRVAFFAQDEWQASKDVSVYAGVRWEGLRTNVEGNDLAPTGTASSVFSPTFQSIWKIPGTKSDQLRFSIGRTYKAPTARDIVPRLWVVPENGPTNPDFRGNPDLRPELAWGADLSYERYLAEGALLSVNGYARRIEDVVMQRIYEENGTWIQSPVNATNAQVAGLGLEGKGQLRQLVGGDGVPAIDLRLAGTRNWSHVDGVPGPGARLSEQAPYTVTAGLDWHLAGRPVTLGTSYVFERGGYTRRSETEAVTLPDQQLLDFYLLWKVDKQNQWRLTVTNALALDRTSTTAYADPSVEESTAFTEHAFAAVKLQYEARF